MDIVTVIQPANAQQRLMCQQGPGKGEHIWYSWTQPHVAVALLGAGSVSSQVNQSKLSVVAADGRATFSLCANTEHTQHLVQSTNCLKVQKHTCGHATLAYGTHAAAC